jgi:hypothetical protein
MDTWSILILGFCLVGFELSLSDYAMVYLLTLLLLLLLLFVDLLEKTPGGNISFEAAPFKLTSEYVDVMGGLESVGFQKFRYSPLTVG